MPFIPVAAIRQYYWQSKKIADLASGDNAKLFGSGMTAISTGMSLA